MKILDENIFERILNAMILILVIVILFVVLFKRDDCEVKSSKDVIALESETIEAKKEEVTITKISVDVKGAVKNPGVYELDYGSRVNDAIKAAGGLKSSASTKYLNLSKKISDETVIKVYTEKQISNMNVTFEVKEECECPTQDIIDCAGASIIEDSSNDVDDNHDNVIENDIKEEIKEEVKEEQNTEQSDNKISINVGTKEELMTLNGIGESKALAIIAYREKNGSFKTLEDIMNVSGIGEAAFSKIKDYIKL